MKEYGLVGAWYFLEGGGTEVFDLTGNNHGTITDTTNIVWDSRGLLFNGNATTARVDLGNITSTNPLSGVPSGAISVYSYAGCTRTPTSSYPRIIDKSDGGGVSNGWAFYVDTPGTDELMGQIGSVVASPVIPTVAAGELFSFGCSLKSGDLRLYRDGRDLGSSSTGIATFSSVTTAAAIGNWNHTTDREWCGFISMVLVSDQHWSAEQHARIDANPYAFLEPALPEWIMVGVPVAGTTKTSTGALTISAVTASGTAEIEKTSTGALDSPVTTLDGTAAISGALTSTGALDAPVAAISGTAERILTSSGTPSVAAVTVSGTAAIGGVVSSSGALDVTIATVDGTAIRELTSSGTPTTVAVTLSGTALRTWVATGALDIGAAILSGTASIPGEVTSTGALTIPSVTLTGVATGDLWTAIGDTSTVWIDVSSVTTNWSNN